jgi:hypothetical protein
MLIQILANTRDLVTLLYPRIVRWAQNYDYNIPSVGTLSMYEIKFLDCESFPSIYNGKDISAWGICYSQQSRIKVASKRSQLDIISTLIHEFAHAVQRFNYGKEWNKIYASETTKHDHSNNKYENEARDLQAMHNEWIERDSFYRNDLYDFVFKFPPPVPEPKPEPVPVPKVKKDLWSIFGDRETYNYGYCVYEPNWYESKFYTDWYNKHAYIGQNNGNGHRRHKKTRY